MVDEREPALGQKEQSIFLLYLDIFHHIYVQENLRDKLRPDTKAKIGTLALFAHKNVLAELALNQDLSRRSH